MKYIILLRHPRGALTYISDDENMFEFCSEQDAENFIKNSAVCQAWLTQIVEVDI